MPFFIGDAGGSVRSLEGEKVVHSLASPVQLLATWSDKLAVAHANGAIFVLSEGNVVHEYKVLPSTFVGLAFSEAGLYSCTSTGILRLNDQQISPFHLDKKQTSTLPNRLAQWRLADDATHFAYGGDEVEISLWNIQSSSETWRAKNVPNDNLGLRQPVQNMSLTFLTEDTRHLVAGSQLGHVRRYDTRAAKKPTADWKSIAKVGGIRVVERGFARGEHQIFVADQGSNLYSLDLRTGKVLYGYKGLAAAVTALAASSDQLVSTCLDHYVRTHSIAPVPEHAGRNLESRGEVVEKVYSPRPPTSVVWLRESQPKVSAAKQRSMEDDEVWENMQTIE